MVPKGSQTALKPLRPSMKEKKRYLVVRVSASENITAEALAEGISKSCLAFLGILYYGKAGILVLKNQTTHTHTIIRVNHVYVDHVKAALMFITTIQGIEVSLDVIGVSGILKKAREKFVPKEMRTKNEKRTR